MEGTKECGIKIEKEERKENTLSKWEKIHFLLLSFPQIERLLKQQKTKSCVNPNLECPAAGGLSGQSTCFLMGVSAQR